MTFKINRPAAEILAEVRDRIARGQVAGSVEWARRLAERRDDPELLRGLVGILADYIENPPQRPRGRPATKARNASSSGRDADGRVHIKIDRDAIPVLPAIAEKQRLAQQLRDMAVHEMVCEIESRFTLTGAFVEVARIKGMTEPEVRKAYYRIQDDSM